MGDGAFAHGRIGPNGMSFFPLSPATGGGRPLRRRTVPPGVAAVSRAGDGAGVILKLIIWNLSVSANQIDGFQTFSIFSHLMFCEWTKVC
jgi:hypothetical protein